MAWLPPQIVATVSWPGPSGRLKPGLDAATGHRPSVVTRGNSAVCAKRIFCDINSSLIPQVPDCSSTGMHRVVLLARVVEPDRLRAERRHEGAVRIEIGDRDAPRERDRTDANRRHGRGFVALIAPDGLEPERRLAGADQLDINLSEELGVEQRAMLGAARIVVAVTAAQVIETTRSDRLLAWARQQSIHPTFAG